MTLYTGDRCIFCAPALEMLREAIEELGLKSDILHQVKIEGGCECGCDSGILGVPAIRICNHVVHGIPDVSTIRDMLLSALMMECFHDQ